MSRDIIVNSISFAYPGGAPILFEISFFAEKGDSIALIGANGAGKTTLLYLLSGLLFPTKGSIDICGMPLLKENLKAVRRRAGYVFSNPEDQLFCPTVAEDVAFGPKNMELSAEEINERVFSAIKAMGIERISSRAPHTLSDGEARRAAMAGVLAMRPDVLLLDEPTSSLDPKGRRQLIETLEALPQTKIIATHDIGMAEQICNKVLLLHAGSVAAFGGAKEILSDAQLLLSSSL